MTSPYNFFLVKESSRMKIFRAERAGTPLKRQQAAHGFTLLELMVVLAILALLGGLVGPKVLDYLGKAKSRTAIVQIAELEKTLDNFKLDVGRYPTTEEGLDALVKRPASANLWSGPYIKEVPKDPWNNPYKYANPGAGGGVEILSLGADGVAGGDGENADIRNKP
jgi:general secretion pathway protein G